MSTESGKSSDNLDERVERERLAHTEDDVLLASRRLKNKFPHIERYPSRRRMDAILSDWGAGLSGRTVLDLGCGRGERSLAYLESGAIVKGIDISAEYVRECQTAARAKQLDPKRYSFRVMDAHALEFDAASIDAVVGLGILHHLDFVTATQEVHRVLRHL